MTAQDSIWGFLGTALICVVTQTMAQGEMILVDHHPAITSAPNALRSNLPGPETQQQVADDFSLSSASTLTGVAWSGYYFGNSIANTAAGVDFTIRLFTGSAPTTFLFSESMSASFSQTGTTDGFNDPIYRFSVTLTSPVSLAANTTYWLSVLDSDADTTVDFRWLQSAAAFNLVRAVRTNEVGTWFVPSNTNGFAFTLLGTQEAAGVPEPASLALIAFGASTLAAISWSRRRLRLPR